ncbi:YfkD famly protein [Gottfriedia luciferensis]|uniref:YfkD famly protein n=1 Tax=Gottfriedia luciferensis TaxID=178774 RepID=UPI000B454780|nr:YfkD famly protein [Gottfriedia luciferensis]
MSKWLKPFILLNIIFLFISFNNEKTTYAANSEIKVPGSAANVTKENTYPNPTQDLPELQPGELARKLLDSSNVKIENPSLIRMFNESSVSKAPFAVGYNAKIFLGVWPLNYESNETTINWQYKKINTNFLDNRGEKSYKRVKYYQNSQQVIRGGLTAKVRNSDEVIKLMMHDASEKTTLPLAFQTVIGAGTKNERFYNVPPKQLGYLYTYAPAVNEKGKVTFGEVYLILKGNKKSLQVKNIVSQGVGAWIPVQDYVSFGYITSPHPR